MVELKEVQRSSALHKNVWGSGGWRQLHAFSYSEVAVKLFATLQGKRRLRVFENRVLRRIFGPKRDKVTGEWRKLHNEEL
jgi:hypothetical protein